ncbi:MAG: gamma-glutamyl-gamma-aminobutyrate hydrolase family protein [Candidatus Nanopelagicales bacterium]|nr:gamma-glutamyl-gamma-aminobutyrate hydrolase family protein [Candidatus Nanopelagicales bacterium]MDZ4250107.1 gamma-glutamyl-gamma-aminobutyrate hydrolase family protein [Candidatus Nanopelagicales bacterium]
MSRPVVGLTCYSEPARWGAWDTDAAVIQADYVRSLTDAGARAVIVPPDVIDDAVLDRIDGLVLAGGPDVDPAEYGADALPTTDSARTERDSSELLLYRGARQRKMPVLGICRGLQIMAVAECGSLHQHLPDVVGGIRHRPAPGKFDDHDAVFAPDSLVARIVGAESATVNSSHHQAVADAGRLTVTGWADDGTVEVAEDPTAPFVLGVQWHPEVATGDAVSASLFAAFVHAAGQWAGGSKQA